MSIIFSFVIAVLGLGLINHGDSKKLLFEFDEAIHFKYSEKIKSKWDTKTQLLEDPIANNLKTLLYENNPTNIADSSKLLEQLRTSKYSRLQISDSVLTQLKDAFSTRHTDTLSFSRCFPVYRDILVFKNKNEITCIAKLCLECRMSHIISSDSLELRYFGQNGEWEQLEKILKHKR